MKNILIGSCLLLLTHVVQAQFGFIEQKFLAQMTQKFVRSLYGFTGPNIEETPINSLLGKVQDAVGLAAEIHSK